MVGTKSFDLLASLVLHEHLELLKMGERFRLVLHEVRDREPSRIVDKGDYVSVPFWSDMWELSEHVRVNKLQELSFRGGFLRKRLPVRLSSLASITLRASELLSDLWNEVRYLLGSSSTGMSKPVVPGIFNGW